MHICTEQSRKEKLYIYKYIYISLFYFHSVRLMITAYDVAKTNSCVLGFVNISTSQQVLPYKQC